jgi:hypothetical protein
MLGLCGLLLHLPTLHVLACVLMQCFTALHMDYTEAYNWATGINMPGLDISAPLAIWHFVRPLRLKEFVMFLRAKQLCSEQESKMEISKNVWDEAVAHWPDDIVIVEQLHNNAVHVPPGWAHHVKTLQPCLKLAWDLWRLDRLVPYFQVNRLVVDADIGKWNKGDYQNIQVSALPCAALPCPAPPCATLRCPALPPCTLACSCAGRHAPGNCGTGRQGAAGQAGQEEAAGCLTSPCCTRNRLHGMLKLIGGEGG